VHTIQNMRKEANYEISDRIIIEITPLDDVISEFEDYIKSETLGESIEKLKDSDIEESIDVSDKKYIIKVKKA